MTVETTAQNEARVFLRWAIENIDNAILTLRKAQTWPGTTLSLEETRDELKTLRDALGTGEEVQP